MTTPVWVLLAFAMWTIGQLVVTVGFYRWWNIYAHGARAKDFPADKVEGSDFYRRAMRAHANCIENLPVYGAVVFAIVVSGAASSTLDTLALVFMGARICQSVLHIAWFGTSKRIIVRFGFFMTQLVCMAWMAGIVCTHAW